MKWFYTISIHIYAFLIRLASLFNTKAKLWVKGRKNWQKKIVDFRKNNKGNLVWFHCASLGEFEQARPLIEQFKSTHPHWKIALSFFSPSGYEVRKNYTIADIVFYLPIDNIYNSKQLIDHLQPNKCYFTKYEIWPNLMDALHTNSVKTYLFSANFRPSQIYFKPWGGWMRKTLKKFDTIFVQNQDSVSLLKKIDIDAKVAGDTRFDRVWTIAQSATPIPSIATFKGQSKLIVAGSTWPKDEQYLNVFFKNTSSNVKLIIAPHEIDETHLKEIEKLFEESVRYSELPQSNKKASVLIIDSIGLLSSIYQYANIAYIGGGFGVGIHNTIEAAAHGCPVIFGPNYKRFHEAKQLIQLNAAKSFSKQESLNLQIENWLDDANKASIAAKNYVKNNTGATDIILS